jgi:hypothetical protein
LFNYLWKKLYNFFLYSSSGTSYSLGAKPGYEKITYPVTFKLSYTTLNRMQTSSIFVEFEVVIREPGEY